MKQKIPCFCDNTFTVEIPDEIDLDANPAYIGEIINGAFLNFTCPSCGKKHKPEFDLTILWPSKNIRFEIFQELSRGEFYRRKKEVPEKGGMKKETIISFPELSERILVYRDSLEPAAVEAIKYYLYVKAEENYPEEDLDIWYTESRDPEGPLEFHIHGIKKDEVAVMKVPRSLYQKTLDDYRKHPKSEIFESLRVRSYLSVKNMMRPEELK